MNKNKTIIIILSSILIYSILSGCSNITNNSTNTSNNISSSTNSTSSSNEKNEYKETLDKQLEEADNFYTKFLEASGFIVLGSNHNIENSTSDSLIKESNDNYIENITYQIERDSHDGYYWLNLRVLLENKTDKYRNITPLGYTAISTCIRNDITDLAVYEDIDRNSVMGTTITKNKKSKENSSNNTSSEYQYFYRDDNKDLQLNKNINLNECNNDDLQNIINELYAIKGYKFKDEKYKNFYESKPWYKGTIEDQNDIVFTKSEKTLLDELVSYKK